MRRVSIFGQDVELQGSPYTFLVFREEFGGDLGEFMADAYAKPRPQTEDFLRIAWAMAKTRDDDVPRYADWLKGLAKGTFTLAEGSPVAVIDSAVRAELFRAGKRRKRLARRAAGFIDRLAKRIGP